MRQQNSSNAGTNWGVGAALGAALGASACCTIPLVLVSLGVSGAWVSGLTALAPYRWLFVTGAVGALGYAGYNEWQLSRRPSCDCKTVFSSTTRRWLLTGSALVVVALVVSPWLVVPSPSVATQQARTAVVEEEGASSSRTPASFQQVVLEIEGMTCKACPITVRKALEDIDGVYRAKTSFKPPEVVVRFDPGTVSVEDLTEATKTVGFPSTPKSQS